MDDQDAFDIREGAAPSEEVDAQEIPSMYENIPDGHTAKPDPAEAPREAAPEVEVPSVEGEPLDDDADSALATAGRDATAIANNMSLQLKEGIEAIRNVRELSRQHSTARAQLEELRRELEDAMRILDHRVQIERSYDQIVAEQTANINEAKAESNAAQARINQLTSERSQLSSRLQALKVHNEENLRPYKNLMDTTKGRADDAAEALADARRNVRTAETQATEATRRREQSIAAANRTVDNAQERLRRVQTELDKLSGDSEAPITALPKMRDELVSERAHLDTAREDLERITAESQAAVEEAQTRLFSLKQVYEASERVAEETKREATERRNEYDRLYKQAKAAENELEGAIKERSQGIAEAEKQRDEAEKRIDEYQVILSEANDIHETPEMTEQLRKRITAGQAELERQDREVKNLAQSERTLRESTRTKRIAVIALVVGAVTLILVLLIWFIATR